MDSSLTDDETPLATLVQWFEDSEAMTDTGRQLMDRDTDFYDGKQWTDAEVQALKKRKQPALVINQIKPEIDYLAGVEKSQRVDPKAYPRNPQDELAAYAATKSLRYVVDVVAYDKIRSGAWKGLLKTGVTAVKIGVKGDDNERDPDAKLINYDRFFWDAHSSELDFSDARYMGLVTWMDLEAAVTLYGEGARDMLTATLSGEGSTTNFDDKPKWAVWGDSKRKRVRMVEMYYRKDGIWFEAVFTKGGAISNNPSPYLDDKGKPENPIKAMTAYIDRDNNRYGQVREMIDPQTDYNKRRSKATHILNSRQVIADEGAVADPQKARRELAQPDAWIEKRPGFEVNVNGNAGLEAGQFQLMQEAGNQLRSNSIKNAMIGGNDQSGRAKQAQQQAAYVEIGDLMDNLRDLDKRIFQAMWNRIKQFWDGPRHILITDDPKNVQHLGLNVPSIDPQTGQPVTENPVAQMNVDLRIEEAPDVTSLQSEDFERFAGLVPQLAQLPPQWAKLLIEIMPHSKGKETAMALLDQMEQQSQQQAPDPVAEEMKKLAVAKEAATVDEIQSKTVLNEANAAVKQTEARVVPLRAAHDIAKDTAQMMSPHSYQ